MSDQSTTTQAPTAKRTRTKRRWSWIIGAVCLVIAFLATPIVSWDGATQRAIRVRVTDNSMEYPISGTTVTLVQARDHVITEHLDQAAATEMLQRSRHLAITNEHGEATVVGQFGAGGSSSMLWRSGSFDAEGVLIISHPKYETAEGLLQNYLQRKKVPIRTENLDVHIFLIPK